MKSSEGYHMLGHRTSVICISIFVCLVLLVSCNPIEKPPTGKATHTPTHPIASPSPVGSSTSDTTPTHYTRLVVLQGVGRPDDLIFDQQGHLLFSDFYNGTVSRVNADGSVTQLISGLAGPEGLVVLPDGTMIIAEQHTNRILSLAPGAQSPTLLRVLPGTPSSASCKDGVDGIALDPSTNTIIVPDSPIGNVYS